MCIYIYICMYMMYIGISYAPPQSTSFHLRSGQEVILLRLITSTEPESHGEGQPQSTALSA